ncbi:hypothetical protein BD413DRAFT_295030 [Trametes elegans]|nr:hypothetical protein BD413DRAFT_295030 [Trametes elegans]
MYAASTVFSIRPPFSPSFTSFSCALYRALCSDRAAMTGNAQAARDLYSSSDCVSHRCLFIWVPRTAGHGDESTAVPRSSTCTCLPFAQWYSLLSLYSPLLWMPSPPASTWLVSAASLTSRHCHEQRSTSSALPALKRVYQNDPTRTLPLGEDLASTRPWASPTVYAIHADAMFTAAWPSVAWRTVQATQYASHLSIDAD